MTGSQRRHVRRKLGSPGHPMRDIMFRHPMSDTMFHTAVKMLWNQDLGFGSTKRGLKGTCDSKQISLRKELF